MCWWAEEQRSSGAEEQRSRGAQPGARSRSVVDPEWTSPPWHDFLYSWTNSPREENPLSALSLLLSNWCGERERPGRTDRPPPATHGRLSPHHPRLALHGAAAGPGREAAGGTRREVGCVNFWCRLRCCLWSLMLFVEPPSHRLRICAVGYLLDSPSHGPSSGFWSLTSGRRRHLGVGWSTARRCCSYLLSQVWHMVSWSWRAPGCCGSCLRRWSLHGSPPVAPEPGPTGCKLVSTHYGPHITWLRHAIIVIYFNGCFGGNMWEVLHLWAV